MIRFGLVVVAATMCACHAAHSVDDPAPACVAPTVLDGGSCAPEPDPCVCYISMHEVPMAGGRWVCPRVECVGHCGMPEGIWRDQASCLCLD